MIQGTFLKQVIKEPTNVRKTQAAEQWDMIKIKRSFVIVYTAAFILANEDCQVEYWFDRMPQRPERIGDEMCDKKK